MTVQPSDEQPNDSADGDIATPQTCAGEQDADHDRQTVRFRENAQHECGSGEEQGRALHIWAIHADGSVGKMLRRDRVR
jgi:hypothetical protein